MLGCTGVVLLLVVGAGAWLGIRALLAKNELEAVVPLASQVQTQILETDTAAAEHTANEIAERASSAASLTSDPIWRLAEALPWAGPNFTVMRELAASVDQVAAGAVQPLAQAAGSIDLEAFAPTDGAIDLQPLIDLQQPVHEASAALTAAEQRLDAPAVADADVIGPLASARTQLTTMIGDTAPTFDALDRAVQLAPALLGADGPHNVLLLFQNNAELRSTGGIAGAVALLRTDNGSFTLVQQANSRDFPKFEPPVVELPLETRALYGDNTASYIQDVNFTPQFPLAASIAKEMWQQRFGDQIDAVVALDPVVLSHLLAATGPINLPTGDVLNAENAVQLLLNEAYFRYEDPADQDLFFAAAAGSVVSALSSGSTDPRALVEALVTSGDERRLFFWVADPAEQALLEPTTLAGTLPVTNDDRLGMGVYLNDRTGSKMDAYLDVEVAAGTAVCRNDQRANTGVTVTLTNTAPADAATSLPDYITGGGSFGTPPGVISTALAVYGMPGSFNLGVTDDGGGAAAHHQATDSGHSLSRMVIDLAPGESRRYRFDFLAAESGARELVVETTPLMRPLEIAPLELDCAALAPQ